MDREAIQFAHPQRQVRGLRHYVLLWSALLACCLAGCGGPPEGIAEVQGEVLLDGVPLPEATIRFEAVDDPGIIYIARTDAQGHFRLMHGRGVAGAKIGKYQVRVSTAEAGNPDATPPLPPKPESIPDNYSGVDSKLRESIQAGGNQLRIELSTS